MADVRGFGMVDMSCPAPLGEKGKLGYSSSSTKSSRQSFCPQVSRKDDEEEPHIGSGSGSEVA